jgi:formylglycine-generating enzyme required for sulfatase activity
VVDWNDNRKRKELREALLAVYPSVDRLAIFVDEELNENLVSVAGGDNLQSVAFDLVKWAIATGRIDEFYEAFKRNNPQYQILERLSTLRPNHLSLHRYKRTNKSYTEDLGNGVKLTLMLIPAGEFSMGAPAEEPESGDDERPQRLVKVPQFLMGRYAVTQAQWRVVAGYGGSAQELNPDPSNFQGDNRPVEQVSWDDAQEFCRRLSAKTGKNYRLPSEAQWEYACRAGMTTAFHFGETITPELANYRGTETYNDSPKGEYRRETTDVGSFPANDWGLHDMHGNVWEWCEDDYHPNYEGAPDNGRAWVESDRTETPRLLRGGSWLNGPRNCRSADRDVNPRDSRSIFIGFRVCCVPPRFSS